MFAKSVRRRVADLRRLRLVDERALRAEVRANVRRRLTSRIRDDVTTELRANSWSVWEESHLGRLLPHLKVDCVFDVGANQGQYATMLREKAGYRGRIISFEPNSREAAVARQAAADDPLWSVEEIALSDHDGQQTFHIMARSQFSSLSMPRHDETDLFVAMNAVSDEVDVQTETLNSAYERLREVYGFERPFLKLDTQGYDTTIVRSGTQVIANFVGLQSELSVRKIYADSIDYRDAVSLYENLGFELSAFVPNNAGHFPHLVELDCIMVRGEDPAAG